MVVFMVHGWFVGHFESLRRPVAAFLPAIILGSQLTQRPLFVEPREAKGIAADDLWEEAIEASLSFANETQLI